jgi:hypothetical protein
MLARVPVVMIVRLDQGIDQGIRTNGSIQFVIEQQERCGNRNHDTSKQTPGY